MNHAGEPLSSSEAAFILRAADAGVRCDGRGRLEPRPVAISFGAEGAAGSVQVRLGETKVLAVATAELVAPYQDRPTEGVLQFFVELSPMASPAFEPGRPSEAAVELTRLLERALRKSGAVDVESLCVIAARRVWSVRCDVTVLDHGGNLADATTLAALAALKHLRLPAVEVSGTGDEAKVRVLPPDEAERTPLVFHHTPVSMSVALLPPSGGAGSVSFVLDPSEREEMVMVGILTIVINQHQELCALHKPGGVPVDAAKLVECVQSAAAVAPQRLLILEKVLHAHALRLAEAAEVLRRTGRTASARATSDAGPVLQPDSAASAAAPVPTSDAAPPAPSSADGPLPAAQTNEQSMGAAAVAAADNSSSSAAPPAPAAAPNQPPAARKKKKRARKQDDDDDEMETVVVRSAFENADAPSNGGTKHAAA